MKTAFFLRSSSDGQASIYIRITEGRGDQFKFATGHAVLHPDHWNKTKQRVRNKVEAVGCDEVNVQLEKLQAFVRQAHLDAKTKGQRRDRDFYLQVIQDFKRGVERSSVGQTLTIGEAFERFIDHASKHNSPITGSRLSTRTLENYAVTLRQIQHVLMDSATLDEVDMDWYHDFVSKSEQSGLNGKPLSKNYIGRHIKGVKSVLAAMEEKGHDVHPAYRRKGFKKITEDSMSIWLTMDELKQMEALDLSDQPQGLALTRDLFLIGCFMEAVPHEGRIFLDQGLVGDTTCQRITDITLVHRQVLSSSRQFCDIVFDEHGKGALSDADGEVVLLEELMVKQLYKDKESLLLYSVSMQANVVTAVEAITDKWTHFTPRDVMVPIDREAMEFPVFIMQHLPRGAASAKFFGTSRFSWR